MQESKLHRIPGGRGLGLLILGLVAAATWVFLAAIIEAQDERRGLTL